ncbi:MAG: transketolase family protein [Thermoplasmata archaeon]|nr:transketolase family protein [Thermoplasmata archaeon]MCI4361889.1 transketolase family protein [Thermoplasmata archaeon]
MSEPPRHEHLHVAYEHALSELASSHSTLTVLDAGGPEQSPTKALTGKFAERYVRMDPDGPSVMAKATDLAADGCAVFASGPTAVVVGRSYDLLRRVVCAARLNVKVVGTDGGFPAGTDGVPPTLTEDIGLMRGLPGMTVVVPADGPTAGAAVRALAGFSGPAYLRLAEGSLSVVTDGAFQVGRAGTLREGADLTIIAIGALVARALSVAEELGRVGVSVRVLDFASVKPFDEKALLRAARETGAILTMEEHSVLTGLGALVASATAEEYPVPVRRIGVPDLVGEAGDRSALFDRYGMSNERCLEEAWTLLRARGKVQ